MSTLLRTISMLCLVGSLAAAITGHPVLMIFDFLVAL